MNKSKAAFAVLAALVMALQGLPALAGTGTGAGRAADSDNDPGSATAMTSPAVYPANLSSSDDNVDYYSATAPGPGQVFNVSVHVLEPGMKVRLVAYDATLAFLEESNLGTAWEALSILAVKSNTKYFFAVYLAAGSGGDYILSYSLEIPTPIGFGENKGGQLNRQSDNAGDWYVITLSGNQQWQDNATFTIWHDPTISIDVYFYMMWPEYLLHAFNISLDHRSGQSISGAAPVGGPFYFLKVWARSGSGNYQAGATDSGDLPGVIGNDAGNCQRLTTAGSSDTLDQAYRHYVWYKLYLLAGEKLKLRLNLTNATSGKYSIYLFTTNAGNYVYLGNASNFVPGVGWTNYVELEYTPTAANFYLPVPSADQGQEPNGTVNSVNARADYNLKVLLPFPLNHAPVFSGIGVPAVPEDTETLICNLNTVFTEPDGDVMTFCVTDSPPNLTARVSGDGGVYVKGGPDWSGFSSVTLSATDAGGLTTTEVVNVQVVPVNDKPVVVKKIDNITMKEDEEKQIPLSEYFFDPDNTQEELTYNITGNAPIPARFDPLDKSILILGPIRGWIQTLTKVQIRVRDPLPPLQWTRQECNITVIHVNHPPEAKQPVLYITTMEDTVNNSVNVKSLFTDPDTSYAGDVLKLYAINGEHTNLTILPDGRLEVRPAKNWNGEEMAYVVAEDTGNLTATINVTITVIPLNDPPEIEEWWPVGVEGYEVGMNETERLNLSVVVTDPDTSAASLIYTWFIDDSRVMGATGPGFTFVTDLNSSRILPYRISVNVSDDGVTNITHVWSVSVKNVNQKAVVAISSPKEGEIYPEVGMVRLAANGTDADGDKLTYSWKEGSQTLGITRTMNWRFAPGQHTVTVLVWDGTDTTEASVTFMSDSIPNATITSPEDRKHFREGEKVKFTSEVYDRDGDVLKIEWRDKDKKVIDRNANFTKSFGQGNQFIYLNVTDGRNSVESSIMIYIDPKPGTNPIPDSGLLALLAAAAIAAGAAGVLRRSRGRKL